MRGRPWVAAGGKGIVVLDLNLRTMVVDSHSSVSSLLPNAGQRMIAALATLWDAEGRPAVDGLDTGVVPPTDAQRAVVATRTSGTSTTCASTRASNGSPRASTGSPPPRC